MHIYFAGASRVEEGFPKLQHEVRKRLLSYHYQTDSLDQFYYVDERDKYESIILDSGAFSAWSQKVTIDLVKYADYALKWIDQVSYVVNLDVIPAEPGVNPSAAEIERSASLGYENYKYLLERGIPKEKLIHVFHQHENTKWLNKMVHEDKMPYIGLSPANDMTTQQKMSFLEQCMPFVTDSNGLPIVKFHGFAVTSFDLMKMFPWYSVDSSTWAVAGGRDAAFIPMASKDNELEPDFSVGPRKFTFSQIGGRDPLHILNALENHNSKGNQLKFVLNYLKSVDVPLGEQEFIRVKKEGYILEEGYRKCSNSFVRNTGFEEVSKNDTLLSFAHTNSIDINKKNVIRQYEGDEYLWVEHRITLGLINYWKERQRLNAIFMNKFVDLLNEASPRLFNHKQVTQGFGV